MPPPDTITTTGFPFEIANPVEVVDDRPCRTPVIGLGSEDEHVVSRQVCWSLAAGRRQINAPALRLQSRCERPLHASLELRRPSALVMDDQRSPRPAVATQHRHRVAHSALARPVNHTS